MIVVDASVALKWFVDDEPLADAAGEVLDVIGADPSRYVVPDLFMNELLGVLCRLPGATTRGVQRALASVEALGLARIGNGHEVMAAAARYACDSGLSGYDAVYVAAASLTGGVWLTADERAAKRVRRPGLVRLLGAR